MKLLSKAFSVFIAMHLLHFFMEYLYSSSHAKPMTYNLTDFSFYIIVALVVGQYLKKKEELKDALKV